MRRLHPSQHTSNPTDMFLPSAILERNFAVMEFLIPRRISQTVRLPPLPLSIRSRQHPENPHHGRHSDIRCLELLARARHPQPEPTVRHTERDEDTTVEQVEVRPHLPRLESLELGVVDEPEDWLQEQADQHDDANDGVVASVRIGELFFC